MFLFGRLLMHDEIFVAEAHIVHGEWRVVAILRALVPDGIVEVDLPIFQIILLECWLDRSFLVFGVLQSIIVPGAGIAIFSMM